MHNKTPLIRWIVCFLMIAAATSLAIQPLALSNLTSNSTVAPASVAQVLPPKVDASLEEAPNQASYESTALKLINAERTKRGLKKLSLSTKLRTAARRHSKDMAKNDFFSHTGSNGSSMTDRITKAGFKYAAAGECLYAGNGSLKTPKAAVQAWLNSPGHAAIMLSPNYTHVGIGYVYDKNSPYGGYYTADFGKPLKK